MDTPGVVPLRAGFDTEFRGYNRKQVLEHIDLLEDQLRMIAIDRDEATKLNTNCRTVCEELRTELDETRARLARISSSASDLPHAMQGMQNMLAMAEDEAETIRQRAERYAETVRGVADTDARQIRADAEAAAATLRAECEQMVVELEARRDRINVEHGQKIDALHARAQDLRLTLSQEYEQTLAKAKEEADALLAETRNRCAAMESESERRRDAMRQEIADGRAAALRELEQNRGELEEWRRQLIVMLCDSRSAIDASVATVTAHGGSLQEQSERWLAPKPGQQQQDSGRISSTVEPKAVELNPADSNGHSSNGRSEVDIPRQQNSADGNGNGNGDRWSARSAGAQRGGKSGGGKESGTDTAASGNSAKHRTGPETESAQEVSDSSASTSESDTSVRQPTTPGLSD